MIRYCLDDLGWYQFECLIQSLLKAEIGLGMESWGGRRDFGIDAYFRGSLNFPEKHIANDGPFIFQIKFVENANAAGAKFNDLIIDAVRKEANKIKERSGLPQWKGLKHYTILTNALLSGDLREKLKSILKDVIADIDIHFQGGNDICDLLDIHPSLRRSFPQLLSIRDLDELLQDVVTKENLERSNSALDSARDIVPVFVPTSAYNRAWRVLRDHNFAVLEGPPEMGKTAIAWMIALAQLSQNWQAIACDSPEDFFACFDKSIFQVFIADDAFGRTEYDPSRGNQWEKQLDRIFRRLDSKHWLIWTSRKHILERARRAMDLQGKASSFPNPAAILIDASKLSLEEKSLILYRHARTADLEDRAKNLVREYARKIISNISFTPERIRRFVNERLSDIIIELLEGKLDESKLDAEIKDAIQNPTDRMRKSFRALALSHKWILISLLEAEYLPIKENLKKLYESHCPTHEQKQFNEVFEELTESFLKGPSQNSRWIKWTHPSYRDLVIEELIIDTKLQLEFLNVMSLDGIKLAISDSGGTTGSRQFPFMGSAESWNILLNRCLLLAAESSISEIADLLNVLKSAVCQAPDEQTKCLLVGIISSICKEVKDRWDDSKTIITPSALLAFCEASILVSPLPEMPKLGTSWEVIYQALKEELDNKERDSFLDQEVFDKWVKFLITIREYEPRFLKQIKFPENYIKDISQMLEKIENELEWDVILDSAEELREESQRLASIADLLHDFAELVSSLSEKIISISEKLKSKSNRLEDEALELETPYYDDYDDYGSSSSVGGSFNIEALFSDL